MALSVVLLAGWVQSGEPDHVRYFPMVAINQDAETVFLIHNPGSSPILVHVRLRAPDGAEHIAESVSVNPLETKRVAYSGDTSKAVGGWAELRSSRPFQATELLLAGPSPWLGVPEAQPHRRFKIFGMVARKGGLQTGVALSNPSSQETAEVEVLLRDMDGREIRRKTLILPPLSNTST